MILSEKVAASSGSLCAPAQKIDNANIRKGLGTHPAATISIRK
jgi:hypothetical protein